MLQAPCGPTFRRAALSLLAAIFRCTASVSARCGLPARASGATPADALHRSLDLAQGAERWGYHRYWLAEHHNMPGIASAATAVVIAHVAAGTKTIRVG